MKQEKQLSSDGEIRSNHIGIPMLLMGVLQWEALARKGHTFILAPITIKGIVLGTRQMLLRGLGKLELGQPLWIGGCSLGEVSHEYLQCVLTYIVCF